MGSLHGEHSADKIKGGAAHLATNKGNSMIGNN